MTAQPPIPQIPLPSAVQNIAAAVRQVQFGLMQRDAEQQRVAQVAGGLWRCDFTIPQPQQGEAIAQLSFGVTFTEIPIVASSFEMPPNQKLTPGQFPTVSAGVYTWKYNFRSDWGGKLVIGASLVLVTLGATNLSVIHHLAFTGKAVWNT